MSLLPFVISKTQRTMKTPTYFRHSLLTACATAALLLGNAASAQEVPQVQVPAPVLAAFNKEFSGAMDVEWKLKGTQYKVEFETGLLFTDHDAWYDATGKLLRHKEEISTSAIPAAVQASIANEFPGHRTDDAERITADGAVSYTVELKGNGTEWDVVYDSNGNQLQKMAD